MTDLNARTPPGDGVIQRTLMKPAFNTDLLEQVQSIIKEGRCFSVDVDLSKFFDRVNHDLLMTHLSRKLADKRLLKLIGRYLRAGIMDC